ncbi:MAG: oligosaccharide flippase family protein, partial [Cyanobacteria bacterium REEB65]|nr:oligosaccharide flippase family protein [Cyanobacteria bacterium REEB65]
MIRKAVRGRLEGRPYLRLIAGNTAWLLGDRLLRLVIGLWIGSWLARYLEPGQFGLYSYALAFSSLFASIATLGLDSIVVRDLVAQPAERGEILGAAF